MPCGKGEILNELLENPMMNATEPVMKSLQAPIRTEEYINISEAKRIKFKSEMLERFGGGGPSGGREPDGRKRGGK